MVTTNQSIISLAKRAYELKRARTREERVRLRQEAIQKKMLDLGICVEHDDFEGEVVCVEGIHFSLSGCTAAPGEALVIRGECPDCHERVDSQPIHQIEDLGEMLVGFHPSYQHWCKARRSEAEEARDILRAWLGVGE